MKKFASLFLLAALLVPMAAMPAKAEPHHRDQRRHDFRPSRHTYHHRDDDFRFGMHWVNRPTHYYSYYYPAPVYAYSAPVVPVVASPPVASFWFSF